MHAIFKVDKYFAQIKKRKLASYVRKDGYPSVVFDHPKRTIYCRLEQLELQTENIKNRKFTLTIHKLSQF